MDNGVGKTLQEARERRDVDLATVAASTKIRVRFLRALENEEWDALPGEAYVRGFIRTYAGYLGLEGAQLVDLRRREVDAAQRAESPAGESAPVPARGQLRQSSRSARALALAALVAVALATVLVAIGLSGGGNDSSGGSEGGRQSDGPAGGGRQQPATTQSPRGLSLRLVSTAEVWVCLLDAAGEPLVDGQILAAGAAAGPFRSGSFTVSFGNGEVSMTVNGQQAGIPATSSPIGYSIGADGDLRQLSEGERPTCT